MADNGPLIHDGETWRPMTDAERRQRAAAEKWRMVQEAITDLHAVAEVQLMLLAKVMNMPAAEAIVALTGDRHIAAAVARRAGDPLPQGWAADVQATAGFGRSRDAASEWSATSLRHEQRIMAALMSGNSVIAAVESVAADEHVSSPVRNKAAHAAALVVRGIPVADAIEQAETEYAYPPRTEPGVRSPGLKQMAMGIPSGPGGGPEQISRPLADSGLPDPGEHAWTAADDDPEGEAPLFQRVREHAQRAAGS